MNNFGKTNFMTLYREEQVKGLIKYLMLSMPIVDDLMATLTPIELPSDEELAILFHNKYEELAPKFGYKTKVDTRKFNKDSSNGKLMIEVCNQILQILKHNL